MPTHIIKYIILHFVHVAKKSDVMKCYCQRQKYLVLYYKRVIALMLRIIRAITQ